MKQRNVMAVLIFSIITLGVYDLFWLANTKKVLNAKTNVKVPSLWVLFAPLLVFFASFFIVIISKSIGDSGLSSNALNVIVLLFDVLAVLVLVPVSFYWFFKFSKAVNNYTNGELNTAVTFILLFVLRFIGLAVIQDKFNDMETDASYGPPVNTEGPVAVTPAFAPDVPPAVPTPTDPPTPPAAS